jgi:hypothetical protein
MSASEAMTILTDTISELAQLRGTIDALFPGWEGNVILFSARKLQELDQENKMLKTNKANLEAEITFLKGEITNLHRDLTIARNRHIKPIE